MAGRRGRAKSYDDQILALEQKIESAKRKLSELEAAREELLKQREEQELKALYQCMTDKGISMEMLYQLIEQENGKASQEFQEQTEQIA
ncbi:MAG: hypothetical protein HFI31_07550 [Lachnospiraceae bacterium]|jgi:hypothetical protein|nr:hypothetical protein [Lachnospiraceae bacterium]MCI8996441.1 hypothetical protein [Lachnospiraceae bacterium]MCI9134025.1 hypothetical protein [Lachnospiraceae bacterium]